MGIFNKKKTKIDEQDEAQKTVSVKDDKKAVVKKVKNKTDVSMKDLYSSEGEVKTAAKAVGAKVKKDAEKTNKFSQSCQVLIKPMITEKATNLNMQNKYAFAIDINANKISVAKAIEYVYGVKPEAVNIVRMQGKKVRRGRVSGQRKNWKKAVVTLPKGKSIQVYEGV